MKLNDDKEGHSKSKKEKNNDEDGAFVVYVRFVHSLLLLIIYCVLLIISIVG